MDKYAKFVLSPEYGAKLTALNERWKAHKMQAKVLRAIFSPPYYKRIFIRAGRKAGKSEVVQYIPSRIAGLFPNQVCAIIGPTQKQQKKIMWNNRRLQNFAPPSFGGDIHETLTMIKYPNGSYIELDGSENYDAHRGTEYDVLILDELASQDRRFYDATYPNLAARDGILVVIGTPPKTKDNLYYELEQEAINDKDWFVIHWTSWDNPFIPKDWLTKEKLKYYRRGEGDLWEREYEAKYVFGGKDSIFPMFSERHVKDPTVLDAFIDRDRGKYDWFVVYDPATSSVFGGLLVAYNRYNGQVFILDEIYEKRRSHSTTSSIYALTKEKQKLLLPNHSVEWTYAYDVAAAWFANEIAESYGVGMIPCKKGPEKKEEEISLIKDCMLLDNAFYVSSKCKNLIWELENYITDDNGEYVKKNDHLIDCLRYFFSVSAYCLNYGEPANGLKKKKFYTVQDDLRQMALETDIMSVLEEGPTDDWGIDGY